MDLAVILPLALLLLVQSLLSVLLLAPRSLSKHIASLLSLTRSSQVVSSVLYTVAVAVLAITASSVLQLLGVLNSLKSTQFGDRALALTVEELRALLAVVLGLSNLVLLFVNKALAHEQQSADKAQLNLSVLQKQARGLQTEYMRATTQLGGSNVGREDASKAEISKLLADKQQLTLALQEAEDLAAAAKMDAGAVKTQAQMRPVNYCERPNVCLAGNDDVMHGLEREYDRLLSENDKLKRRLAQLDPQFSAGNKK
eukprot:gene3073-3352_t